MRPYRNISDEELKALGALREWEAQRVLSESAPFEVLWVHTTREKFHRLDPLDTRLVKRLTVTRIQGEVLKTNFGSYALSTGKNIFQACGCKRFCDCYGQLYLLT